MKRLESMLKDERSRKAARKAVRMAGALGAKGGRWAGRAAWRVARASARALANYMREHRVAEPEAVARFDGEPFTRMVMGRDGGVAGVLVRPVVLTPARAKWGDFLGVVSVLSLSALGLGVVGVISLLTEPALYWWPVAAMGSWPFTRPLQKAWRDSLRIEAELMFTPARFCVRVKGGAAVFHDRQTPHRFRMRLHEKAKDEAERDELIEAKARSRGNFIRRKKYYRDTYTLEFVDGHYPRHVLDIMGQREAERILARVNDVDDVMEQLIAMGNALAKGPEAQWDDMPGKIPEKV